MSDNSVIPIPLVVFACMNGLVAQILKSEKRHFPSNKFDQFNKDWETDFRVVDQNGNRYLASGKFGIAIKVCETPKVVEDDLPLRLPTMLHKRTTLWQE